LEKDFDFRELKPIEILQLLPIDKSFDHNYTHLVARFCYGHGITIEKFLNWIQLKHNPMTSEVAEKWAGHFDILDKFPPVSTERIKTILAYYYPSIKKEMSYRDFQQTFYIPTECIVPIETMTQECFTGKEKYSVSAVGMGGGKTEQTIRYLKNENSFCWICPNKALATNTHSRLLSVEIDATHYLQMTTKSKKEGKLVQLDKLVVVLNSLHYLTDKQYDVIVIDEVETLLDKFLGDFLEQGMQQLKLKIWNTFINILRKAKKVIMLDAFITTKTTDFIKLLEGNLLSTKIYRRIFEPCTRTIKYMNEPDDMIADIISKLKNGNKVFIFYPYKNKSGRFASMEQLADTIEKCSGCKGIFYNADVDDKIKIGLKNVNESWGEASFIITNNIITCGINYEKLDFDYKFLFVAPFNSPRDVIQVSYRARYLSTGIIKICYMGAMNQVNAWLNDCNRMNDPLYTALYKSILVEKKAPIKKSVQLFCVKAHYKQESDETTIDAILKKEITDLLEKNDMGFSYATIPDIGSGDADYIQTLCFAQEATMLEKMQLQKYFFKREFSADGSFEHEMIETAWDNKCTFFFRQLKYNLLTPTSVFNKIKEFNKLPCIFPADIKKTKLNSEIIEQIFKEFTFKFITKTSSPHKILKEIYNIYFTKHVVKTSYDKKKNINYFVEEIWTEYYEFAKEYLILDQETKVTFNNCQSDELACEF
jgi:hypothetical protein